MARRARGRAPETERPSGICRTAIYARLSREDNLSHSESIENQLALLRSYVNGRAYLQLAGTYIDNGYTGTDFDRPEWQRLMTAVRAREIDCIVVKDLSRLGRNYIETGEFLEKICPFFGVRFIAINDHFDTARADATGQLSVSLSNIINDYYAKDISRKVSSALRSKMEHGDYVGSWEKYGYLKDPGNKNHLIVNPETAPVVRQIFQWRSEGMSYRGISRRLNDSGVPSPGQYKADRGIVTNNNQKPGPILWGRHVITAILHDITYLGHLAQRKNSQCLYAGIGYHQTEEREWIVVEHTHEPLISQALFDRVQEINRTTAEKAKASRGKHDHLPRAVNIYGRKFTCADCGAALKLTRSFSRKRDKAYFTFKCPTFTEHGPRACNGKKIRKSDLDEAVLASIQAQLDLFVDVQDSLHRLLALRQERARRSGRQAEARALRRRLEHKKGLLGGLYRDLREGLISEDDYAQTRQVLMEEIGRMEQTVSELAGTAERFSEQLRGEQDWAALVRQYRDAGQVTAELVEAMIDSMQLRADGSLHIEFRHMDEFRAIVETVKALKEEVA